MSRSPVRTSSATVVAAITVVFIVAAGSAQGSGPGRALPDEPQIFSSRGQTFRVVPIKGLARPWGLAILPNGDILVTEQSGQLRVIRDGVLDPEPLAGMPTVATTMLKGLMDIVLHPDFTQNQFVYFTYSKPHPENRLAGTATLARGRYDGGGALMEVRDLFQTENAWAEGSQAARLQWAPDGTLFMSVGIPTRRPVGKAESAQDPASHAGKILRLNADGTAPADNPFVGQEGYLPEIYALGIRNAIGLMIHPDTGELWETENGPQGGDEINIIRPGANYGWPVVSYGRDYSGNPTGGLSGPQQPSPCAPGMEQPFTFWSPSPAVSGMILYTGDKFPEWRGDLLVGSLRGTALQRIVLNEDGLPTRHELLLTELGQRIRDVRQGPDGLIYLTTDDDDGALLRLEPVEEP